jgi:hypothetical protein
LTGLGRNWDFIREAGSVSSAFLLCKNIHAGKTQPLKARRRH